jgi:hypothetical protein
MYNYFSIFATILIAVLILMSVFSKFKSDSDINNKNNNRLFIILSILLLILFIFTRLYKLSVLPRGVNVDEAGMMYDSYCLSKYGVDRYLKSWPVYFINHGGGMSALYTYIEVFIMKLTNDLDIGTFKGRLPAVMGSFVLLVSAYTITRITIKNKWYALLTALLITICPYFIMASRWGLDCNLFLGFFTLGICSFIIALKYNKNYLFIISGLIFGLTLYSYILSYLTVPLFLVISYIYLYLNKKINIKNIIFMLTPMVILALPLVLMLMVNNDFINEFKLFNIFTISKMKNYRGSEINIKNVINNLYIVKMLLVDDGLSYNAIKEYGTLYLFSIPLVIYGLFKLLVDIKNFKYDNLVVIMFISVLFTSLLINADNIWRSNAIYFSLVYFIVIAIIDIVKKNHKLIYLIIIIYFIGFMSFSNYYFTEYQAVDDLPFFDDDLMLVTNYVEDNYPDKKIYIDKNVQRELYIYLMLEMKENPYDYSDLYNDKNINISHYYFVESDINDYQVYLINRWYIDEVFIQELEKNGYSSFEYYEYLIYSKE